MPGAAFKYVRAGGGLAHGTPIPFNVSITRAVERYVYYWEYVPHDLYNGGKTYRRIYGTPVGGDGVPFMGAVNSANMWDGKPAGTVLFERVEPELLRAQDGNGLRWRLAFHFAYAPRGWLDLFYFDPVVPANNGWYRASASGTFFVVNLVPDLDGLYCVRDLNQLWNPN